MRASQWRIRRVGRRWHIFEPGWAFTSMGSRATFGEALALLTIFQTSNGRTLKGPRGHLR
ncbi:hypothetical protein ATKI12_6960 [Kitasatospora sp. Ki12]